MGRAARAHGALRRGIALGLTGLLALGGCAGRPPPCPADLADADTVALIDRGWHVEIGLRTADLGAFAGHFPPAESVVFGYGKRTFFTARTDSLSEYLLGPVPGPAAIQVTFLKIPAADAYAPADVSVLRLPPGGGDRIAAFLASEFARDKAGAPLAIGPGPFPGSVFYAASSGYSLAHTCNTWVAEALHAGGLPIDGDGVVFSGQVVARATRAGACAFAPAGM